MKIESVDELGLAYDAWRSRKQHAREAVPDALLTRARGLAAVHGVGAVLRATKISLTRLVGSDRGVGKDRTARVSAVPSFSRVKMASPAATNGPIAELEMRSGLKLRIFTQTHETLGLLSSLCLGGAR